MKKNGWSMLILWFPWEQTKRRRCSMGFKHFSCELNMGIYCLGDNGADWGDACPLTVEMILPLKIDMEPQTCPVQTGKASSHHYSSKHLLRLYLELFFVGLNTFSEGIWSSRAYSAVINLWGRWMKMMYLWEGQPWVPMWASSPVCEFWWLVHKGSKKQWL